MKNNGITLVALVVTIIILLILAGVTIAQLGEDGLLGKAIQTQAEHKKQQYYEETNLEIYDCEVDIQENPSNKAFITTLAEKIGDKDWVSSTIKCDEFLEEQEDDLKNTILIIETKDGYEIIVDVNNSVPFAKIREGYFQKVEKAKKVVYDANGGTGTIESQEIRNGFYAILSENNFERANYSFIGWSKDKEATQESEGIYASGSKLKIEEDTTLYAVWKRETVTVSFDGNTGSGTMEAIEVGIEIETTLPENTFEKEYYEFVKWNTKADGTGEDYTDKITISEEITLYAIWQKEKVTVSFNKNGGTGTMSSIEVYKNEETNLPTNTFARTYFTFTKWNTKADGTGVDYTDKITTTENITLYAIWVRTPVTITLNKNDGTTTKKTVSAEAGVAKTLPAISSTFTRSGYTFQGWSTTATGSVKYSDQGSITPTSNITLYAKWLNPSLTITYANSCYYINTNAINQNLDTTQNVKKYLFDGNTNNGGRYKGILLAPQMNSYMLVTVKGGVTIYAYGHYYSDSAGGSGKNLVIQKKQSNGTYAAYKSVATKADGTRYKLVKLEEGEYKMTPASYYVNFDEWEIVY